MAQLDSEKTKKIWNMVKTIIEIILAALTGAVTASTANATGLLAFFS